GHRRPVRRIDFNRMALANNGRSGKHARCGHREEDDADCDSHSHHEPPHIMMTRKIRRTLATIKLDGTSGKEIRRSLFYIAVLLTMTARISYAQTTTTDGTLQTYSTIHSIGLEWPIVGDSNHNAIVSVAFR